MRTIGKLAVLGMVLFCGGEALAMFQPPPPAMGGGGVAADAPDISVFYEPLSMHGEWVRHDRLGWVFVPFGLQPDWRPYMLGRWVYTDYGWTWLSYEPFGWATYHYGRWDYDWRYGWVWVPDTEWGPGWVAWRQGNGWIGWAALPPEAVWNIGGVFEIRNMGATAIPRFAWCFVEARRFIEPQLGPCIAAQTRNVYIVDETRDITRYSRDGDRVISACIEIGAYEKMSGRRVDRWNIRDERSAQFCGVAEKDRRIDLFRPHFAGRGGPGAGRGPAPRPALSPIGPPMRNKLDDLRHKHADERAALERRIASNKAQLEDRQRRERDRVKRGSKLGDLDRKHRRERAAFDEQCDRERKLLERQQQRELDGSGGLGKPNLRRFIFGDNRR